MILAPRRWQTILGYIGGVALGTGQGGEGLGGDGGGYWCLLADVYIRDTP